MYTAGTGMPPMWPNVYSGYPAYPAPAAAASIIHTGWTGQSAYHQASLPQAGTAYTGMAAHVYASTGNAVGGHKRAHSGNQVERYSMLPTAPSYGIPQTLPVPVNAPAADATASKQKSDAAKFGS